MGLAAIPGRQTVLARSPAAITGSQIPAETPPTPEGAIHFDRITMADGLPGGVVHAILQDRQGFMWFGTSNGLARYDGYEFTVYHNDPDDPASLSHDLVLALSQTRNGELWIGTGRGLDRFDPTTRTFTRYGVGYGVLALCEDELGVLWVGTTIGLTHLDPANPGPSAFFRAGDRDNPRKPSADWVNDIVRDREGQMWLGTGEGTEFSGINQGLDRYDQSSGTFIHYRNDPANPNSLSSGDVQAVFEDRQGGLWAGTLGGLSRLDRSSETFARYQHDPSDPFSLGDDHVTAILEDTAGRLWVGTAGGLEQLDRSQNRFFHYRHSRTDAQSLSSDVVLALYEDRSGVVWIGTTEGISRYDETASQFALYRNEPDSPFRLSDDAVQAVVADRRGMLWVGTRAGGLNRLDRGAGTVTVYRHDPADPASLSSDGVTALFEDRVGDMWVGTDNHWLERFDPQTESFVHYWYVTAAEPHAIAEDQAGDFWIGTANGLYRLNRTTQTAVHYRSTADPALSYNEVTAVDALRSGWLVVGTNGGGVNIWDPLKEQFHFFGHDPADPNSLSHNAVYSFYEEPDRDVRWIGTWRGLDCVDTASGTTSHYTEKDGLPGNAVIGIVADRAGMLWLTTNRGLARFDPRAETFRTFDAGDGLPAGQFELLAVSRSNDGEILLGSSDGLVAFYPDRLPENPQPPPMVITTLSLFNEVIRRDLPPGEPVELSYKENFLSFEFAALDYTAPEKNSYAYMLEGVDPGWVEAGTRRRADYPDLRPGSYVFRVKGSNNAGVWNGEGVAAAITITPPFWGTSWFRGIVLFALAGIATGGYRLRVRSIERRSRELKRQVADRTAQLSEANILLETEIAERRRTEEALAQERASAAVTAERNRLARELHDSATQSLYAVTLYADAATRLLSSGQVEPATQNLHKLRSAAKEALGEMRMVIFELRPPILAEEGLAAALAARLEAVEGRAGLKTELHVEGYDRLPPNVEEGLYGSAVEALNNTLRHAQASCVSVSLHFAAEDITLEVADDGIGFDPASAHRSGGLGLKGMAERAEHMGGTLTVESKPGTGTRVRVVLPGRSGWGEVPE